MLIALALLASFAAGMIVGLFATLYLVATGKIVITKNGYAL